MYIVFYHSCEGNWWEDSCKTMSCISAALRNIAFCFLSMPMNENGGKVNMIQWVIYQHIYIYKCLLNTMNNFMVVVEIGDPRIMAPCMAKDLETPHPGSSGCTFSANQRDATDIQIEHSHISGHVGGAINESIKKCLVYKGKIP